jgi:hypothetical protein
MASLWRSVIVSQTNTEAKTYKTTCISSTTERNSVTWTQDRTFVTYYKKKAQEN